MRRGLDDVTVRPLRTRDYESCWREMRDFTDRRDEGTPDEFWLVEHLPVFTLGKSGRLEHLHAPTEIPVVHSDRGGQITYHGPGQLVVYLLLDLARLGIGVRDLVTRIERAVIGMLAGFGVEGDVIEGAPGVYVGGAKVAALGLRVRRGRCFHGLSINVDMDLEPFELIDPCGYAGLAVTQMADLGVQEGLAGVAEALTERLRHEFGYRAVVEG